MGVRAWSGAIAALTVLAGTARGQGLGLPLGDTAGRVFPGYFSVAGGLVLGEHADYYGVRGALGLAEPLRVFVDYGMAAPRPGEDSDILQAGAVFTVASEKAGDLALRGAFFRGLKGDYDVAGFSGTLVGSAPLYYVGLYTYGGAGICFRVEETETTAGAAEDGETAAVRDDEDTAIDPSLTLGLLYAFPRGASIYAEASYIDAFYFGAGLRYQF